MHAGDAVVDSGSPKMIGFVGYAEEKTHFGGDESGSSRGDVNGSAPFNRL